MVLLKFGIFEIDYTLIILFIIGLILALFIFGIVFLALKLSTKNKNFMVKSKASVTKETGSILLVEAEKDFYHRVKDLDEPSFEALKLVANKLMDDIAILFFPKSKMPLYELTIDELLELFKTASRHAEEKLNDGFITRILKGKFTISGIINMTQTKEDIEESPIEAEKSKFWSNIGNAFKAGLNKVKDAAVGYVLKKSDAINKIFALLLRIIGQETFDAFYRKIYNEESEVDFGIDEIVNELAMISMEEK